MATMKLPRASIWHEAYIYMVVGVVGTTIAPWMQFYLQARWWRRVLRIKQYAASRLDVIVGSSFHGCRGVVHYRGVRGNAVCARDSQHQRAADAARR